MSKNEIGMERLTSALGDYLRAERTRRGLSLTKTKALTGVSRSTLNEIENKNRVPYLETITKILDGLSAPDPVRDKLFALASDVPELLDRAEQKPGLAMEEPEPRVYGLETDLEPVPVPDGLGLPIESVAMMRNAEPDHLIRDGSLALAQCGPEVVMGWIYNDHETPNPSGSPRPVDAFVLIPQDKRARIIQRRQVLKIAEIVELPH